ncbi:helix-turn-helix domain-containing protein [Caballeronia cordobensis]|uniref:helix-turn-helix domain-containing protein n=1 Tax=Caballeronia cordobensis TaxID=1353886 RepID=UPI0006AD5EBE|nr:helix-turn-helix domain-containing protein [Caballeronia cordobensis]
MTLIALIRDEESLSRAKAVRTLMSLDLQVREENIYIGDALPRRPASERPALQKAIGRLWPNDLLVVFDLVALGNSPTNVLCTLQEIRSKGASVACISLAENGYAVVRDDVLVATLALVAKLNTKVRKLRACDAAEILKQKGTWTGRPSSLDAESRRRVLDALASGTTVTEVAKAMNTSRQTIMRIRARGSG